MQYEQGRVSHAVGGCMRSLLQDWHLMVTQLEHQLLTGHLTLQVSSHPALVPQLACVSFLIWQKLSLRSHWRDLLEWIGALV